MVINHMTMAQFRTLQVIPYCYINIITCVLGGIWYLMCDGIARVATLIAQDLEVSLRHVGPSQLVAEYRAMWMLLSKIVRDVGMAFTFEIIFLALYLFFIITLTIYGLFSQIQSGFGIKDVGLTITASLATMVLYYICDEAHYASYCVKVLFQKKLLLVELSWMNEDAQQEIQMFLRATEMSETSMSLGGFFDVNRTLFKSLLATMVTYLVVLLQFQISLPEDLDTGHILSTMASLLSTVK
ncbi:gustatory and odorant receptor 24 [Photinus pyralis]|nr:gustatory and odorant receptor 24 [Photinus pyralis]